MFGRKSKKKVLDNYAKAASEFEKLLMQQVWDEYRTVATALAAICQREGDLWAYDREMEDIDMQKFDVHYDEENKALVFSYGES